MVATVLLFSQENCPLCPAAKRQVTEICNRLKVPFEVIDVRSIMGYKRAIEYNVLSTPTILIERTGNSKPVVASSAKSLEEMLAHVV